MSMNFELFHFNFKLMYSEMQKRGIELSIIPQTDIVAAVYKGHREVLVNCDCSLIPAQYMQIFADKFYAKQLMASKGYSVVEGQLFESNRHDLALYYAKTTLEFPVVLKPNISDSGVNVYADIRDSDDFVLCFNAMRNDYVLDVMVEKYQPGDDYRFLVTQTGHVAVVKRTPAGVVGDGHLSIGDLIEKENFRRMNPRNTCLCEIYVKDIEGCRTLTHAGYDLGSVPAEGEVVPLRHNSNVSYGGYCEDVTDEIHPSYICLAKEMLSHFPGLGYAGIDLLITDINLTANTDNYAFLEINSRPGYSLHTSPGKGKSRPVVAWLIDMLFPETR